MVKYLPVARICRNQVRLCLRGPVLGNRYKNILKRVAALFFAAACLVTSTGCGKDAAVKAVPAISLSTGVPETARQGYKISAAVLYNGGLNDGGYVDTLDYLKQPTLMNLSVGGIDVSKSFDLKGLDILYLDKSIIGADNISKIRDAVVNFTESGGSVFLDNAFYDVFDKKFIGAKSFVKVAGCPTDIVFPEAGSDIRELQGVISDFAGLYKSFNDYAELSARDYGYAVSCDTASPIAMSNGYALYTLNRYGKGLVFFTNPLLPNVFSLGGFSMQYRKGQKPFSNTTAGCNQLLLDTFAGYVSKQLYGYYIGRVFGSFGSTDMSWELHYEEITGIRENSLITFSELCKKYLQVPSYTLIRNSYWWFRRAETVTYYLGRDGGASFDLDLDENAYSSGTHIESGGEWLNLESLSNAGSYFTDYPEYTYRAYPELCDYNSDGVADIFCGSSDGGFYYYEGKGFSERLHVSKKIQLKDPDGNALAVSGYSAPNLADINGDGFKDIISGSADGNIYWFSGNGSLVFKPEGVLIDTDIRGQSLPSAGDLNNDGVTDIVVGSNEGILIAYYGKRNSAGAISYGTEMGGLSLTCANAGLGKWLAPEVADFNGDGRNELAVGTFDGYVAMFSDKLEFSEYMTTKEKNYKGNNGIKTGNNCVPVFYDINSDGVLDLVCGSLEYGLAYPIDSPYFPYSSELQEQVDYAKANRFYLGAHFYTNSGASAEREAYELERHKEALEKYGVEASGKGTNQHTWYMSFDDPAQSLISAYNKGILWDSGFSPSGSAIVPQISAENVVSLPFFLTRGGERGILVQNCSVLPYKGAEWTDISAKYGVPVCVFYHCDFVYESDAEALDYIGKLSDFWWKNGYSFVMENQLMAATAAAYNTGVSVEGQNLSRSSGINISISANELDNSFPLYDRRYQQSAGAKIVFSESVNADNIITDSDVMRRDGNSIYISLNKPVSVRSTGEKAISKTHLERVNVAAEISTFDGGAEIAFKDDGMMQAVVSGRADTKSEGWTVTERDGKTIFTKYGDPAVLKINYT